MVKYSIQDYIKIEKTTDEFDIFACTKYQRSNGKWYNCDDYGLGNELASDAFIDVQYANKRYNMKLSNVPVHLKRGQLSAKLIDAIISAKDSTKTIGELYKSVNKVKNLKAFSYYDGKLKYPSLTEATVKYNDGQHVYMDSSKRLSGKAVKCGGELKMSYYHNIMNHIFVGVDISGNITSSANRSSKVNALRGSIENGSLGEPTGSYIISYDDKDKNKRKYNRDKSITFLAGVDGTEPEKFFWAYDKNGIIIIPERTYTIEQEIDGSGIPAKIENFIASNPDYKVLGEEPSNASQYLQISNEKGGDVTFEKNKFNSRAAVVLGAQYKGWFAGIRGGVSYNQGKIHAKDITGTFSEDVSFAAPFVGVHLMKSINMKGLENGHIYVTADVNVQNKQNLKMKGIKNFRQNSVNVSLGMTWKIN